MSSEKEGQLIWKYEKRTASLYLDANEVCSPPWLLTFCSTCIITVVGSSSLNLGPSSINRIFTLSYICLLINHHLCLSQNSQLCQQPLAAFSLKQSAHPPHHLPIMPLPQSSMMPQVPPLAAQAPFLKICTRRGQVVPIVQPQRVRLKAALWNQLLEHFLPLLWGLSKDAFHFLCW